MSFEWRDALGFSSGHLVVTDFIVVCVEDNYYNGTLTREDSIKLAVAVLQKLAPEKLR